MEENFQVNGISDSLSKNLSPVNFPSDVHKWMKLNANPKMALKLMKVCKYFRHSDGFPYLVVTEVLGCKNNSGRFQWFLSTLDGKLLLMDNFENITKKLWIIAMIHLSFNPKAASTLLTKTAVCNIKIIELSGQQITLEEFKFLNNGGLIEECAMFHTHIITENGEGIPLEDIFECLPNARKIIFGHKIPSIFSLEAAERKISSKLKQLTLWIPPNDFDLQKIYDYTKNHQKVQYRLLFWGISAEEYAENIAPFFNKMIEEWTVQYKKPEVCRYPGN